MKIAMIGHKRIPSREGGVEIVVGELSRRMAQRGHTVVAYNRKSEHIAGSEFNEKAAKEWENVKLKWVPTPASSKLNAIVYSALAALSAATHRFDVVHFHAEGPSSMVPIAKLFGKRCIVTIHGLDWQRAKWGGFATRFLKYGEKTAAKHAHEIIVLSRNVQEYFRNTYNRETVYIPNGIEQPEIKEAAIIRENYGLTKDSYLLFLGRLVPEKGVHYLIDAYQQLNTDKKLVIAGAGSHTDDYADSLHRAAEGNPNIIFTGFVQGQALEELFSNAYCYCLPSDLEGMPISLLEGMSYGNCCLTSDIPECTEVCRDHAVYFEKSNVQSLKETLERLINNEEEVQRLKAQAATYICQKFNWEEVCDQTLALYQPD